jgi:phospholipase D1/2
MNAPRDLAATLSLYNDTVGRDTGRYFCDQRPFSSPRTGNKVTMLSCGRNVFRNIYEAMIHAESFIWIADWQMGFDIELVRRGHKSDHSGQLHKVIEKIISSKPVHVRILLFASVKDSIPGTYDALVAEKINSLNKPEYPGSVRVLRQKPTSAQNDSFDYSHHQKFLIVDGRVGFLGGIDLSYGRWDTPEFDVVVDPGAFVGNEMYNPCAVKLRSASESEKKIFHQFDFNEPYNDVLIDEGCQPRMPWQDVHIQIEGPSVVDIHRNFVRRWNAHLKAISAYPSAPWIHKPWLQKIGAWKHLESVQPVVRGGAQIQIVRSVSNSHLGAELERLDDLELFSSPREQETWKSCLQSWRGVHQDNILNAMANCIRSADNYIYIETQFFISNFGTWRSKDGVETDSTKIGNEDNGIKNIIVEALAMRICDHIKAKTQFHVYLVIPAHPEGLLSDLAVIKQHRAALLTIKHGSNSLINRIRRLLVMMKRDPGEWINYLTVLNMRNYGATVQYARDPITKNEDFGCEIGRFVVTEQIYIHSKLMIVDDAVAIIGSANINDRSLTGNGDTEIAAVIVDTEGVELRDLGSPTMKVQTRKFARELRQHLWSKHFGFLVDSAGPDDTKYFRSTDRATRGRTTVPVKVEHPPRVRSTESAVFGLSKSRWEHILEHPCAADVIKAIQTIASKNAAAYEAVFEHVPRDKMSEFAIVQKSFTLPYPLTFDAPSKSFKNERFPNAVGRKSIATENATVDSMKRSLGRDAIEAAGRDPRYSCVVPAPLNSNFMMKHLYGRQLPGDSVPYGRALQLYEGGKIHDVTNAIKYLKSRVLGFFVAAPLDWGMGTEISGDLSKVNTVDIH